MENVPVVILCGGMGTRLSEETETRPKPLVEIGGRPILWHIMKHYSHHGFNEFILALGYKGQQIKHYFLDFYALGRDFTVSLGNGEVQVLNHRDVEPWKVHLVDTGLKTQTGGRLRQLREVVGDRTFMMTYGDGVSDVSLSGLLSYHRSHQRLVTLTAVRPMARFGAIDFDGNRVRSFKEKTKVSEGWINGGFFVIEPAALEYVNADTPWEREPLEQLAANHELNAYQHHGFWQCMDNLRDMRYLESLWESGSAPWMTW